MAHGHLARLSALALATGTLVAVSAAPVSAATTVDRVYEATNSGAVLRVKINLPAGVPGVLPQSITQDIVLTDAAARTGSAATALGNAFLGANGNVPVLQGLLDGKAQATPANPKAQSQLVGFPKDNPLGLTGGLLLAESEVATDPNADGVLSRSTSSVASLQLPAAGALAAVLAPLQDALDQALSATRATDGGSAVAAPVGAVTATVEDVLGGVLDTVDGVTSGASAPVSDTTRSALEALTAQINDLLDVVTGDLSLLSANDSLLDIGLIENTQSITKKAGTTTSTVSNELAGINLLGGLVTVEGISSIATASLGASGAGNANADATLLKANIADLLNVELTDKLEVLLGGELGSALPADVVGAVNEAIAQINALLASTLGLEIRQAVSHESASKDIATAMVEPAALVLNPLGTAEPLLSIGFVPAEATVKAQSITSTPVTVPGQLPRTGNEQALAAVALMLVGGALVIRRRRATV